MTTHGFPSANPDSTPDVLQKAVSQLKSKSELQKAIKSKVLNRIEHPKTLSLVRDSLTPARGQKEGIWQRVLQGLGEGAASPLWDRVRASLGAASQPALWQRVLERISVPTSSWSLTPALRFAATFVLFVFLVRMSPALFAPPTAAKTDVELRPTLGEVSVLIGGLFQPVDEPITLSKSALIQTGIDDEATIIFHDAAVLRLGANTTVSLHDLSERPSSEYSPTMTVYRGKLWVQSFLSTRSQPLTIGTEQGIVQVREGSISFMQGGDEESAGTDIRVWNRSATVVRDTEMVTLFAGDRVTLQSGERAFVTKMSTIASDDAWTKANLASDLVHQREIARLQQQRLAKQAGVLPTSAFYPVKRLAEQVDVLMTIGSEAKAEKLLQQAETRLSEAAALIAEGSVNEAKASLDEYKQTIQEVASGSGDTLVHSLVTERVALASEAVSAALPDDSVYLVKEAVTTALADSPVQMENHDAERELLSDQLAALVRQIGVGADPRELRAEEQRISAAIAALQIETDGVPPTYFEEARATLIRARAEITAAEARLNISGSSSTINITPIELSDSQVDSYVSRMLRPLNSVTQLRTKINELYISLRALRGHPDAGRILRKARKVVQPELQHYIDLEINLLNKQMIEAGHSAAPEEPVADVIEAN